MKRLLLGLFCLALCLSTGCSNRKTRFSAATDVSGLPEGIWDESTFENSVWGE